MKILVFWLVFISFTQATYAENCRVFLSKGYDQSISVTENLANPLVNPLHGLLTSEQKLHQIHR